MAPKITHYGDTSTMLRRSFIAVSLAAALAAASSPAVAQESYPDHPIRLVVPYPAGGGADGLARMVAQKMSGSLGQSIIIENKPGANTMMASNEVSRAKNDGYTILYVASSFAINPSLYDVPYDTEKAFTPIGMVAEVPLIIISNANSPYKTLDDLISAAKAQPGYINFGSYGLGSPAHLGAELLESNAAITMNHVPYKGSAPALNDLLGGQIPVSFSSIEPSLQHIRSKRFNPIAVMSLERVAALPDVPTVAESIPGFEAIGWNGLVAPAGTPPSVIEKLNAALNAAINDPDIAAKYATQGVLAKPMTAQAFGDFMNSEIHKWATVIKDAGIKFE